MHQRRQRRYIPDAWYQYAWQCAEKCPIHSHVSHGREAALALPGCWEAPSQAQAIQRQNLQAREAACPAVRQPASRLISGWHCGSGLRCRRARLSPVCRARIRGCQNQLSQPREALGPACRERQRHWGLDRQGLQRWQHPRLAPAGGQAQRCLLLRSLQLQYLQGGECACLHWWQRVRRRKPKGFQKQPAGAAPGGEQIHSGRAAAAGSNRGCACTLSASQSSVATARLPRTV